MSLSRKKLKEIAQKEYTKAINEAVAPPSPSQQALQAIQPALEQIQAMLSPEGSVQGAQMSAQGDLEALAGIGQAATVAQEPLMQLLQMAQDPNLAAPIQAALQQLQTLLQDALPAAQEEAGNDMEALDAVGQDAGAVQQGIGQAIDTIQQQGVQLQKEKEKAGKEQKRQVTQAGLVAETFSEALIKTVKDSYNIEEAFKSSDVSKIYQVEAKMVISRDMNIKDLFNSIRAIEGVTVVSTEAQSFFISPTLQRSILTLKFLKGIHSVKHYLQLLATAIKRLQGVKSLSFGDIDLLKNV